MAEEQRKKPVGITETVLRDAHQSLIATRMTTEQMLPIVDEMDKVGYNAVECWGGATFDVCMRFLKEDPWERLRKLRAGFKHTKLQMLFRGQNILGYNHYADDVVEYFVQKSIANGIDIIRIFDCVNDLRNLQTAVKATKKEGGHAQVALSYTIGDAYTLEYWEKMAKEIEEMGADSICIKDMAGLLLPYTAEKLVKAIKAGSKLPLEIHTHYTSGVASMTYMKAVEAGADIIDTAASPFAMGTSQPATEVMVAAFQNTPYDTGLDLNQLVKIGQYFQPMREEALKSGLMSTKVLGVNINTLRYQVPGGMLSNLVSQLKSAGAEDKLQAVLEEVPKVREDFGEPPLVTPSSQIVGTQAVLNVLQGERYKMITKESKKFLHGDFGKTIRPFNPEVQKKAIGDDKPITCRPADLIKPQLEDIKKNPVVQKYKQQDEDILSYALFPQVAEEFFKYREAQQSKVDPAKADKETKSYPV
ncbi:MAG: oxaloacetate decarboxylase subunit alpha [Lachnospiraceae bacterium]|nr:oxaloacetate decarboxylase subunit alpha [Lachnospiraceae bacterium]MCH4030275.1 oxaloacetate decarboxylase subunit alpha [Lachnospiraceae bacterium]MCH4069487.1 oxaloacetate decarboxylase subunit alpha [Lachnospiraceae bacterium]MCH4107577.1 oxaloacetate decarboxylase subunit alpha [Lachnospiraceae bacterium]MCI1301572.1 oxaloacetate decarboxylase subunit alpha [Lachnospiraceae bacterium]